MPTLTLQQKGAASWSRRFPAPRAADSENGTPATDRPLKISIVFDEDVSARSAEILIKRTALNLEYNVQSFAFDELYPLRPAETAARNVSDTDILMVAVRNDRALPDYMHFWLGLCLGLREQNQEGLLVVLIVEAAEIADPDSSLLDYLKIVAAIGGMAFISQQ